MTKWRTVSFEEAVEDLSAGNPKIPQTEFLPSGVYPIVDQGKALVAGYTDDSSLLCRAETPAIVFGDHTRCIKFVDFPFCLGADGVKVLRPRQGVDAKYLYHYLRQIDLTDGGYDRHFKYLRRATIAHPELPEQRRIADILDKADALRAKRRRADSLVQMLGESILEEFLAAEAFKARLVSVGEIADVQGGLQVTSARNKLPSEFPYLRVANVHRGRLDLSEVKQIRATDAEFARTRLEKEDFLIVEGHGNPNELGRGALWDGSIPNCVHQNHLIRVRFDSDVIIPEFAAAFLNSRRGRQHLIRAGNTTSGLNTISVADVRKTPILVPPLERQRQYHRYVDELRSLRASQDRFSERLGELFASLQHRAFRGELTA